MTVRLNECVCPFCGITFRRQTTKQATCGGRGCKYFWNKHRAWIRGKKTVPKKQYIPDKAAILRGCWATQDGWTEQQEQSRAGSNADTPVDPNPLNLDSWTIEEEDEI